MLGDKQIKEHLASAGQPMHPRPFYQQAPIVHHRTALRVDLSDNRAAGIVVIAIHVDQVFEARCQTYFPGERLRAINRFRDLSGQIKQQEKLIIAGTHQRLKARRRGRRMLKRSARDHRSVVYAFERRGTSNAVNRELSDVHNCSLATTMMLRKMLSFNVSFLDRFPAPPTHTLRRNSPLETIVPGRHNTLRAALPACGVQDCSVALPPAAPALPEQFLSEEELQELWSEVGHWTALRVIQPGGLNHKYV
jgi:hypothetical protein